MIQGEIIGTVDVVDALAKVPQLTWLGLVSRVTRYTLEAELGTRANLGAAGLTEMESRVGHRVKQTPTSVTGTVFVTGPAAAYQEFGFSGSVQVDAHLRIAKRAFGRSILPRPVDVRAHVRKVDYPGHSFLRDALAEIEEKAPAGFAAAVEGGLP